jgi:hypothetical protein
MTEFWRFDSESHFEKHCGLVEAARKSIEEGEFVQALAQLDYALDLGESPHARWNRALTLLALGRYTEGWQDYQARWHLFANSLTDQRGARLRSVLPQWQGEDLAGSGKRLVVIHEAGFGDTIMLLRYVHVLRRRRCDVALVMPPELERLAEQVAPLLDVEGEADVYCTTFDLPRVIGDVPPWRSYLVADLEWVHQWRDRVGHGPYIGIAWSTAHPAPWRNIDLAMLHDFLNRRFPDHMQVALQTNDLEPARSNGIVVRELRDFADLAALITCVDKVISIDTAALNLAGALGHADVTALLPAVPCWRWLNGGTAADPRSPWYPQIKMWRQTYRGDWSSALVA